MAVTQLLTSSNGNGAGNGGGAGGQAAGGPAVASSSGGASLMATGNTHHLFDSAPPIQECVNTDLINKRVQRRPRIRAMVNRSARLFVQK